MGKALDRIEAAIGRIERAADRGTEIDPDLPARHERLKASVSQSLARLDDLIARQAR